MQFPKTVDRGFVKFMMVKRLSTGGICLVAGVIAISFIAQNHAQLHAKQWALMMALLGICFGGGAWMLRDGLRLRSLLGATR
jgi:hypothetical protein